MINNKNRLQWTPLLLLSCLLLMDTVADASWHTRRRRRKELAQKQEQAKTEQTIAARKSKITDLKKLIDVSDAQVESTDTQTPAQTPNAQSIFDEDKYALPIELQQEAPRTAPAAPGAKTAEEPTIEFNFEGASLQNLIQQIEAIFDVTFITDDAIDPLPKGAGGVAIKGNKITFKTNEPLSKQEAWDLFITFLDVSGFTLVQQATPRMYRIKPISQAYQSTLRTFIGTSLDELPDSDEIIRFMYFIENSDLNTLVPIITNLKSQNAPVVGLQDSKAILITDKSYNIKSLMQIVKELDKVSMPQAMSVLKLRQANAKDVADLYKTLTQPADQQRAIGPRKPPTSLYFPENTKIIAEERTNSLILLGQRDAIQKIEDFIIKNIDIDLEQPYSPLNIYKLKYADAETIAKIMNETTRLGVDTPGVGTSGGVRGGDKYLKPITFTPEKETNQIIIKGGYEDYMAAKEIIDKLDIAQPQIAIEVLILELQINDIKGLGAQLRSKETGCADNLLGKNITYQTSGLYNTQNIVTNPSGIGATTLLGNLISLATAGAVGNTILTLGQDIFGVWGVFALLQTITNTQIISNPFLVATNKTSASVKVGQTRRVVNGVITTGGANTSSQTNTNQEANLQVTIKPQINSDGMIILDVNVHIERFTATTNGSTANTSTEDVKTFAIVSDKEVLALGGLIQNNIADIVTKVPILGDIPIIGWLFKNRTKTQIKTNLLILISAQIIRPEKAMQAQPYTKEHINDYRQDLAAMVDPTDYRDPVYRSFFKSTDASTEEVLDSYLFERHKSKKERLSPILAPSPKRKPVENDINNISIATNNTPTTEDKMHAQLKKKERTRSSLRDYMSADAMEAA